MKELSQWIDLTLSDLAMIDLEMIDLGMIDLEMIDLGTMTNSHIQKMNSTCQNARLILCDARNM